MWRPVSIQSPSSSAAAETRSEARLGAAFEGGAVSAARAHPASGIEPQSLAEYQATRVQRLLDSGDLKSQVRIARTHTARAHTRG